MARIRKTLSFEEADLASWESCALSDGRSLTNWMEVSLRSAALPIGSLSQGMEVAFENLLPTKPSVPGPVVGERPHKMERRGSFELHCDDCWCREKDA